MSDLAKRLRIKAGMIEMGEMIAWGSDSALMREAADALGHVAGERKMVGRPQIREVFMRNGARIEPGSDDLPDYVYESTFELLEMTAPVMQGDPVAAEIELLERQSAEHERLLAESRANDQQAMAYLSEVRAIVGGDDFPDMVRRCEKLLKDADRIDWLADPNNSIGNVQLPMAVVRQHLHSLRDAIDAAMEPTK